MKTRITCLCPGKPIRPQRANAVLELAAADFPEVDLRFHPQCFETHGHFAGVDEVRLEAFVTTANDHDVDAIWFAMGGYGSNRLAAPAIAALAQPARNKIFLGYSDTGTLLGALYRNGIGSPVHGPLAGDIKRKGGDDAVRRVLRYLSGQEVALEAGLDGRPTVAFNLMTLAMLCGTDLMPDLSGHIVLVEEVAEHLYAVDRLFFHVTQHLRDIAGLRLGRIGDIPQNDRPFGMSEEEIARYWCERTGIPYLGRADIGHDAHNAIVPFGVAKGANRA